MCRSVFIVEGCLALLAEESQRVDRIMNEPLRWCCLEVLPTLWAVLALFVPLKNARATEEGLAISANDYLFGNVEAAVALKLLS